MLKQLKKSLSKQTIKQLKSMRYSMYFDIIKRYELYKINHQYFRLAIYWFIYREIETKPYYYDRIHKMIRRKPVW